MSKTSAPKELVILAKNINTWRKNKKYLRERMPTVLKEDVVKLCGKYGAAVVCKHTGLTNPDYFESQFKRQNSKKQSKSKLLSVTSDSNMTELVTTVLSNNQKPEVFANRGVDSHPTVEITTPAGTRMLFQNHSLTSVLNSLKEVGLC